MKITQPMVKLPVVLKFKLNIQFISVCLKTEVSLFCSPADPSDSQAVDSSTSADEPTSASSADVLTKSKAPDDEEMEDLDLEPTSSSSTQQPSQLPHKDSEPSAQSPECEEEEETSLSPVHQPSNEREDGD